MSELSTLVDCDDALVLLAHELSTGLDERRRAALESHLRGCEACRTVRGIAEHEDDLDALPLVDSRYYVRGRIGGEGGMGRVIIARDRRLGRNVALKETLDLASSARFAREIRITARLDHPSIVAIHEAGRWPDGAPFFAMRWVDGESLAVRLATARTWRERAALIPHVIAAAQAIAYAHEQRVIHRDLKPGNILIGPYGETVVIDWGLARDLDDDTHEPSGTGREAEDTLTADGAVLGTPAYMSPEQARGEPVDERTDVFALGAILYHTLTGRLVYEGASAGTLLDEAMRGEPPFPVELAAPEVPPDLVAIVDKALAGPREERYASAKALADDLARFQTGQLVGVHRYTTGQLVRRWLRRHRAIVVVATVAAMVVAILAGIGVTQIRRERAEALQQRDLARVQETEALETSTELLLEQGRQELVAGRPSRALPYLAAVYPRRTDDPSVRLLVREAMTFIDHERWNVDPDVGEVWGLVTTDDGDLVVIGSSAARVLDPATGATLATLYGRTPALLHGRSPNEWRRTPDGRRIAVRFGDRIDLWDVPTRGRVLSASLLVDIQRATHTSWHVSPRGDRIATVARSLSTHEITITSASGERKVVTIGDVVAKGFDATGQAVVVSRRGGGIGLVEVSTGHVRWLDAACSGGRLSSDGARVACEADGQLRVRELATGREVALPPADEIPHTQLYLVRDEPHLHAATGERIATLPAKTWTNGLVVRDRRAMTVTTDVAEVWELVGGIAHRRERIEEARLAAFARDGAIIVATPSGRIRRHAPDASVVALEGTIRPPSISISSTGVITGPSRTTQAVTMWDVGSKAPVAIDAETDALREVLSASLSSDGHWLVTTAARPDPRIRSSKTPGDFETTDRGVVRVLDLPAHARPSELEIDHRVVSASPSPDGTRIVVLGKRADEAMLGLYDIDGTMRHQRGLQINALDLRLVGMTRDASHALVGIQSALALVETGADAPVKTFHAEAGALAADGTLILADGTLIRGHADHVTVASVAAPPDAVGRLAAAVGRAIAFAGARHIQIVDGADRALLVGGERVSIVKPSTAEELATLAITERISRARLFDRAKLAVVLTESGEVIVADAATGRPLAARHVDKAHDVVGASERPIVAVVRSDGSVVRWMIELEDRTPAAIAEIVEKRAPWQLEAGRLTRKATPPSGHGP